MRFTITALGSKGYAEAGLFTHWAEIAGACVAERIRTVCLTVATVLGDLMEE